MGPLAVSFWWHPVESMLLFGKPPQGKQYQTIQTVREYSDSPRSRSRLMGDRFLGPKYGEGRHRILFASPPCHLAGVFVLEYHTIPCRRPNVPLQFRIVVLFQIDIPEYADRADGNSRCQSRNAHQCNIRFVPEVHNKLDTTVEYYSMQFRLKAVAAVPCFCFVLVSAMYQTAELSVSTSLHLLQSLLTKLDSITSDHSGDGAHIFYEIYPMG